MRVLLDTNVLIAAIITPGVCSEIPEHCLRRHWLVTSEFVLNEFRKHLVRRFRYSPLEAEEAIELLRSKMEIVTPVALQSAVCRDPDDDVVLGTAAAGGVACIVTGDKDLLVLKRFGAVDTVSPSEFLSYEATR
jgi:putative PIN family toxin of toxin-antitoxin system